jgi:hypothetical protein
MRFSTYASVLLVAAAQMTGVAGFAQQMALARPECPSYEPDSLQISWTKPCEEGDWLLDTRSGCRMWDWHPDPKDRAVWNGICPNGKKEGAGVVQWFEHGQPIDRFEGIYRNGKREGFGRYVWNESTRFEGHYANDLPHGFGSVTVVGETFTGDWRNGCFRKGDKVIAIGVARTSCGHLAAELDGPPGKAAF